MRQNVSALMDGELFDDEADTLLGQMGREDDGGHAWAVYHLIGDVLRQPEHIQADIRAAVCERLQSEPTVLAPRHREKHNARWFALSAAASVMALVVVAWLSAQAGHETKPQMAMQKPVQSVRAASFSVKRNVNDYVMAHQNYSPASNQDAASYIRVVSDHK